MRITMIFSVVMKSLRTPTNGKDFMALLGSDHKLLSNSNRCCPVWKTMVEKPKILLPPDQIGRFLLDFTISIHFSFLSQVITLVINDQID